ncbi:MAG TPA: TonB-dependent receptor [Chryseosolibacter sp.]
MKNDLRLDALMKRLMRITLLQLALSIVVAGASIAGHGHAKQILDSQLTLDVENQSLKRILERIEQAVEVKFAYSKDAIDSFEKISLKVEDERLGEVLDRLLKPRKITYVVIGKQVILNHSSSSLGGGPVLKSETVAEIISGSVTTDGGESIPGVNILLKGTTIGIVTDADGKYSLEVADLNGTLVFSYIGYSTMEVPIGGRTTIDVSLVADVQSLQEVVVVGYGTQKKVNLTGAVSSVGSEELEKRTVPRTSLALQGQMSGITVRQASGNPGRNSATLTIRGPGTFSGAGNSPLVLIDMIEGSMDDVNPNDIASISILKDAASAAIFGSKAANGVILIETKKGFSGKPVFSYNAYVANHEPTMIPDMVNSWEYAEVVNEMNVNMGQQRRYTDEDIQKFRAGNDPNFPNFDHIDYLFGSGRGLETKHDISMRGGNEGTQYMFSAGYYDQQGIIKKNSADRYNVRLNLDTKLHEKLRFSAKLAGTKYASTEPASPYGSGLGGIISGAMRNANAIHGPTPDGFWGRNETLHPEADLNSKSFTDNEGLNLYSNASMVWDITKNLKITGQLGYTQNQSENKAFIATYPITPTYAITLNSLNTSWAQSSALTLQSFLEYTTKIGDDHAFKVLAGTSGQSYSSKSLSAFRDALPNNEIYEIDAGATVRGRQGGSAARNTLASYFGRFNYNFREKYLLEANFRYDGSSRFPADSRWGLFPSFSAGWRISQEGFFANVPLVSDLKLRASWGELGNQSIGNYPYQDLLALGVNYPFGNLLSAGAAVTTIANKDITWETTRIVGVGVDLGLFEDKLTLTADYFKKTTFDILYNVSVSDMLGASPSATNAGTVENKGWDFDLKYRNRVGDFSYGASAIFSVVHNKVVELANVEQDIARGLFTGHPIGSAFAFVSDGLFVSDDEVANYATQPFAFLANAGGIKYVDISGPDGVPDGVVNATYDRTVIGQPLPITTYAFTFNGAYKNFDFNIMLQGEGGRNDFVNIGQFFFPLENNSNVQRDVYENRWTKENPDANAPYPKIMATASGFYSSNRVDFWNRDATFLRLKNLQVGYSLPKTILDKTFLNQVRFYVTGENLFTMTKFYKGWDPEMVTGSSERFYPLIKAYVAGVNVKF